MPPFINRKQLQKATDEEIEKFFSETTFEGIYSFELKSKNSEFYKGSITDIKLEGRPTTLVGFFLNVPHNSIDIQEGPCAFKCRMNVKALRESDFYKFNLLGSSLHSIKSLTETNVVISAEDTKEQDLFEMWGVDDCQCIGYYHYDEESDIYIVDDLRKPNFDHIPYYPIDNEKKPIRITYPHEIRGIKINDYYLFTWKLSHRNKYNPYEIYLDFKSQPISIEPKWFINTLFNDRHNDKSKNFGSATNFLDTLSKQLSAKESTFVYELLQNANDYPVEGCGVNVEFHITDNYLLFMHTGDKFNVRNISGICGINEKEKVANKKTIGYKGIGFKTVFLNNHYVYLRTGAYSFRFDEGETPEKKVGGKIKRLGAPFQILPIWTEHTEVTKEVNEIFDHSGNNFRVQIALRPDDKNLLHVGKSCYENLFKEIFADSNIILFIPNINSVRIFINGLENCVCVRNNEQWVLGDYEEEIDIDIQKAINKTIEKGNSRIPEKYNNFDYTKVSFACKHEGAIIKPIDKATLYCYLPTKASWGFPFLMNSDMIPKGDRNDIETEVKLIAEKDTNFNEVLAAIAGDKLFDWILDLLTSKKYQLGSVFSLFPNFQKCKKEHDFYEDYIERFEDAFDTRIENGKIVPISKGIANVKSVVLDTTGLSTSGLMTDEEFLKFTDMEDYYLPLNILRKDKNFNVFLKRYANDEQKFEVENITDLIANKYFQEWLENQDNNNTFLKFLLDKEYLEDLLDEKIFLEVEGGLYKALDLFFNIDKYLDDIKDFTNHICYLSPDTRKFFEENEEWNNVIEDAFASFDCEDFVNDILLSQAYIYETKEKLNDKEISIHFYKFLSENVAFDINYTSLPFINNDNEVEEDFEDKFIFLKSKKGQKVFKEDWLASIDVAFVSQDYTSEAQMYFKENFGVQQFSDEVVVEQIILSEEYHDKIVDDINEEYNISKAFIDYCYTHKDLFESGFLHNYALNVYNINGENVWCLSEDHIYFLTDVFEEYSKKEWLDDDWMYSLDSDYYDGISNKVEFNKFIEQKFRVEKLSNELFYTNVVKPNLKSIIANTSGNNDSDGKKSIDFIKYLDDNYRFIFEEEKDSDIFNGINLVSNDISDLDVDDHVYVYNQELADIIDKSWFPDNVVYLCNKEYGNSKALIAIGCNTFTFGTFYDNVIVEELDAINDNINTKEDSIAFHNFIIEHSGELTTNQQGKMSGAKIYLYGNDEAVNNANGHKILSAKAKELFKMGLVEFADLDLIDPEYKAEQNSEYWETRLENTKFTITHFYNWLKENIETFKDTLQDVDLNINFWRWLKENVDDRQLESIQVLPIVLKDGSIDNDSTAVYFSDEYLDGSTIEQSVLKFDEDALFISPNYIRENEDIEDWKNFWSKLGIKYEIVDILIETIIPNLADIEDEGLPKLIADNREALEKNYEEDDLISHLTTLRVKGHDNEFYSIDETVYIDCEKEEPFPYVELPNQISFKTREERELIKDIIEEVESDYIETLSEWQQRKLDYYLEMQDEDNESVRDFHYRFIDDLSIIRNNDKDSLKEIVNIEKIYLLNKDDEFCEPSTLTMGSVYKPFFDFESCGIDSLEYVSDSYIEECHEYPGRLFLALKVHCDIQQDDLEFLESRVFAIYFWGKYLKKKEANISRIKDFLEDSLFDNIACIPTKDYMKKPCELYYGAEVSRYVMNIEDWENKIPLKDPPEIKFSDESVIFNKLPFKESLNFLDALYALVNILGQERRTQLLQWMIEDYDSSYDEKVNDYREDKNALWYNNNNKLVQIKRLYALDYWKKTLDQYFGTNPRIVNRAYFPSGDSFKETCDILHIQTITLDDLDMQPVDKMIYSARGVNHRLYALAFAALIKPNNWQELYSSYTEKLEGVVFYKCKSILIRYIKDAEINQALKKFYHKPDTTEFYFVKDLDDKLVYESYVKEFTKYLNIDEDNIPLDLAKIIMDSRESALENIKEQNSLMLDEAFKDAMDELIPDIKRELFGNEAEEDNEDVISNNRPSFKTQENDNDDQEESSEYNSDDSTETHELNGIEADDEVNDSEKDYELLSEDKYELEEHEELEALQDKDVPNEDDFINVTKEKIVINGIVDELVCEHYRNGTWACGHMRNGSNVSAHSRIGSPHSEYTDNGGYAQAQKNNMDAVQSTTSDIHDNTSVREPRERNSRPTPTKVSEWKLPYTDMRGWDGPRGNNTPSAPKPFSPNDVSNFGSHGITRTLNILEPTTSEIDEINSILGEDLTSEQVADQNYLAQLRLYNNLVKRGMTPDESKVDFVSNAHMKNEHTIGDGKYIHKCSATGGIMYLSPAIWNKIADKRCVVCVYLGAKSNEFMYFNSIDDILKWIDEDDIVIKLTGEEKASVVEELYSGVLRGVKGTAYTLVRINSNEKYNSLFAQLPSNDINNIEENEDEY
ncbi:MAG: hypothetical protein RR313_06460 [Anaerovoracaceae bacterium]